MERLDNFLDAMAACLVVAVLAAVAVAVVKLSVYLPFGILFPVLIFGAGAGVGCLILFYAIGGSKCKDVTQ